jgi:hypothetical protein
MAANPRGGAIGGSLKKRAGGVRAGEIGSTRRGR